MKKFALMVFVALMISGCSDKPTKVYNTYLENIQKNKPNDAFNLLDKKTKEQDSKNKDASIAAAKEIKGFIDGHKGLKKVSFKDLAEKGDTASAQAILLFNDGYSSELKTKFVKENGVWKLSFAE